MHSLVGVNGQKIQRTLCGQYITGTVLLSFGTVLYMVIDQFGAQGISDGASTIQKVCTFCQSYKT